MSTITWTGFGDLWSPRVDPLFVPARLADLLEYTKVVDLRKTLRSDRGYYIFITKYCILAVIFR